MESIKHDFGEGNGNPLQYSCLENPMDRGAWWAVVHGVAQSRTRLKWLSMHACIGEGNGNSFQYSCLENPRDGGAWWAAVYGISQSWTQLKWHSSSSSIEHDLNETLEFGLSCCYNSLFSYNICIFPLFSPYFILWGTVFAFWNRGVNRKV